MSDAFNAAAWILGELSDSVDRIKNNMVKPINIAVDDVESVNIGDPVDLWLNRVSPQMMNKVDESAVVGPTSAITLWPTDLFRLVDNGDGTKTAIFMVSNYCYKYTLDENMVTINYERVTFYSYLGLSSTSEAGFVFDAYYDDETGEEWFLTSSGTTTASANGFLHKKLGDVVMTYTITFADTYFCTWDNSTSRAHPVCGGHSIQRLSEDIFAVSAGDHVVMLQLNDATMACLNLADYMIPVLKEYSQRSRCHIYADLETKKIYTIAHAMYFSSSTKYYSEACAIVLSYDLDTYGFTELSTKMLRESTDTSLIYPCLPQGAKLHERNGLKTVQTVFEVADDLAAYLFFVDFDAENNISFETVTLPESGDADYRIAPISTGADTVVFSIMTSTTAALAVKATRGGGCETYGLDVVDGETYRLVNVDGMLMGFFGSMRYSDGNPGVGKCSYLYRKPIKMGVVIDKDTETIEVAQQGINFINIAGSRDTTVDFVGGTVKYVDTNLIEL